MILEAGNFKVSKYRKAIPDWVKVATALQYYDMHGISIYGLQAMIDLARSLRYDHRPPLSERPYDIEADDFVPSQNDPNYIEAIPSSQHDERTFGRKEGAAKTVTTINSDAGRRKRIRKSKHNTAIHKYRMAVKEHGEAWAARLYPGVFEFLSRKPKIKNRGFPNRRRR